MNVFDSFYEIYFRLVESRSFVQFAFTSCNCGHALPESGAIFSASLILRVSICDFVPATMGHPRLLPLLVRCTTLLFYSMSCPLQSFFRWLAQDSLSLSLAHGCGGYLFRVDCPFVLCDCAVGPVAFGKTAPDRGANVYLCAWSASPPVIPQKDATPTKRFI